MFAKGVILVLFVGIVISLAMALRGLSDQKSGSHTRTVKALTVRIGLSVVLFALLFVLFAAGVIQPHSLGG